MRNVVAFIPAKPKSERIPGKNTRLLNSVPLLAYSVRAAVWSGVFRQVFVVESDDILAIGLKYGADLFKEKPVTDLGLDIRWVRAVLEKVPCDAFAILRPTSPFRTAATIQRAWREFEGDTADSLRAVELVKQTPFKMWMIDGKDRMTSILRSPSFLNPAHSLPTQTLPKVYIQNASLEIARRSAVERYGTISGVVIRPFFTEGIEGFDLNTEEDWSWAEAHAHLLPKL